MNLLDDEIIDDLQLAGLKLIQKNDNFKFGVDAVLASNFARVKNGGIIVDFGTGSGIIAILLSAKTNANKIYGFEIQKDMACLAQRSVQLNNLEDKITIINDDIKNASSILGKSSVDAVVCNPPYKSAGTGILNKELSQTISRHEVLCNLEDVIKSAAEILKPQGYLTLVHRPGRIADIIELMRKYKIEPKFIRFVFPKPNKKPVMVLIRGAYLGGKHLEVMEPLYIMDQDGKYSKEIDLIYNRNGIAGGFHE